MLEDFYSVLLFGKASVGNRPTKTCSSVEPPSQPHTRWDMMQARPYLNHYVHVLFQYMK